MLKCYAVWKKYNADKISIPFRKPVAARDAPGYYDLVKEPMDLESVHTLFEKGKMSTPRDFARAMRLIYLNAMQYNPPYTDVYELADELRLVLMKDVLPIISAWKEETGAESDDADDEDACVEVKKREPVGYSRAKSRGGKGMAVKGKAKAKGRVGAGSVAIKEESDGFSDAESSEDEERVRGSKKEKMQRKGSKAVSRRSKKEVSSESSSDSADDESDDSVDRNRKSPTKPKPRRKSDTGRISGNAASVRTKKRRNSELSDDYKHGDGNARVDLKKRRKSEPDPMRQRAPRDDGTRRQGTPPARNRPKAAKSSAVRKKRPGPDSRVQDRNRVAGISDDEGGNSERELKSQKRKVAKKDKTSSEPAGSSARGKDRGRTGVNGGSAKAKRGSRPGQAHGQAQSEGGVKGRRRQS
eukprot:Plantae.Rhodophyta-Palmaria_palmata.ctg14654.p1 GENE.Plantae.Rhodophyta-Palmaria_palmata.ctg14654~~Plantae.Rhodophyta-Palmaria_palmata.ctg14654.p1  ORF type:complete len:449 (+),score=101.16 Plantae.Rhodophyta-Palmaria_palmata.ctg14654:111-1349(+)